MVVVTGAAFGVNVARDGNATRHRAGSATAQLASIERACGQWRNADAGSNTPAASWCTAMVGWMTAQTNGGHMSGAMMWGDPGRIRDTCQRWMASAPEVTGSFTNASSLSADGRVDDAERRLERWHVRGADGGRVMAGHRRRLDVVRESAGRA